MFINLAGWLLRQSMVRDRAEIKSRVGGGKVDRKYKPVQFALHRQVEKLVSSIILTFLIVVQLESCKNHAHIIRLNILILYD